MCMIQVLKAKGAFQSSLITFCLWFVESYHLTILSKEQELVIIATTSLATQLCPCPSVC